MPAIGLEDKSAEYLRKLGVRIKPVEEGETIKKAMQREALEEAGIGIESQDLIFSHVMYRKRENASECDRIDFFFSCNKWKGTPKIIEKNKRETDL